MNSLGIDIQTILLYPFIRMKGSIDTPTVPVHLPILEQMSALADPVRCRILLILERHELTVSELCSVLQLPQSTVSRHLKWLADHGWVEARPDGTSRYYEAKGDHPEASVGRLWRLVGEQVGKSAAAGEDRRRLQGVLGQRGTRSQEFFSSAAGKWAEMRRELFGQRFDLQAMLGLLDDRWVVGDLGCGTGQLTAYLAPFVGKVIGVDDSDAMLEAAGTRIEGAANVELRRGRLERLPIEDGELDVATLVLVLHHLADPESTINEVARSLRDGGRLLVVDMLPHDHEDYRRRMGRVWLGFGEDQLSGWLEDAGFGNIRFHQLPPERDAKGPTLFVATAAKARFPSSID